MNRKRFLFASLAAPPLALAYALGCGGSKGGAGPHCASFTDAITWESVCA